MPRVYRLEDFRGSHLRICLGYATAAQAKTALGEAYDADAFRHAGRPGARAGLRAINVPAHMHAVLPRCIGVSVYAPGDHVYLPGALIEPGK